MKVILDTHVLIWWLRDKPELGAKAKALIANPDAKVWVSVASLWEVAVKARLGKMDEVASALWRETMAARFGVLAIDASHIAALEALEPPPGHKDPFDHLIAAQAIAEDALLVTGDRALLTYPVRAFRAK